MARHTRPNPVKVEAFCAELGTKFYLVLICLAEGDTYPKIASRLCIPLGTVRSRINRGRAKLAKLMAETPTP